jgi:hypothetical protein
MVLWQDVAMVGGPGAGMKGLEGYVVAFYLEPKVMRRCNLGGGREDKLEQRFSRKIERKET